MDNPTVANGMKTSNASIIATLVALCVATNYMLVSMPNVKVMDFMVFIGDSVSERLLGL